MAVKSNFASGDVLTASDVNTYLTNGGLVYITEATIGTAVTEKEVTNCFSSTYDVYLITVSGGVGSAPSECRLKLGSTITGYYVAGAGTSFAGANNPTNSQNVAQFNNAGVATTDSINAYITLNGPYLSKRTYYTSEYIYGATTGGGDMIKVAGYLNNATSYTSFTFQIGAGTMTGGKIRVYGYRQA